MISMKYVSFAAVASFFLLGSFSSKNIENTHAFNISGTVWEYVDEDASYAMYFKEGGRLISYNPDDVTRDNDDWHQKENKISFSFNDNYSTYKGTLYGQDSIVGKGSNGEMTWDFVMYFIK